MNSENLNPEKHAGLYCTLCTQHRFILNQDTQTESVLMIHSANGIHNQLFGVKFLKCMRFLHFKDKANNLINEIHLRYDFKLC